MNYWHSGRTEFRVSHEPWSRSLKVWIYGVTQQDPNEAISLGETVVMRPLKKDEQFAVEHRETFRVGVEEAQQLMDELWRVGLRPTEGTGSAGALAAAQAHLRDMRALVFKPLNMEPPKGT